MQNKQQILNLIKKNWFILKTNILSDSIKNKLKTKYHTISDIRWLLILNPKSIEKEKYINNLIIPILFKLYWNKVIYTGLFSLALKNNLLDIYFKYDNKIYWYYKNNINRRIVHLEIIFNKKNNINYLKNYIRAVRKKVQNQEYYINILEDNHLLMYLIKNSFFIFSYKNKEEQNKILNNFIAPAIRKINFWTFDSYLLNEAYKYYKISDKEMKLFVHILRQLKLDKIPEPLFNFLKQKWIKVWYTEKIENKKEWKSIRVLEFEEILKDITQKINQINLDKSVTLKKFSLQEIIATISSEKYQKKEVYYHTITEWYDIDMEEVEYIYNWWAKNIDKVKKEKIENYLLVQSYKQLFQDIIKILKSWIKEENLYSFDFIKNINYWIFQEMFKIQNKDRKEYWFRNHTVKMNHSEWYLPPETTSEILDMLEILFKYTKQIKHPFLRWIFFHFFYVPIQWFWDGNWRTARILNNFIWTLNWYQWITIKNTKYRIKYLSNRKHLALWNKDELYKDFINFTKFLIKQYKKAVE